MDTLAKESRAVRRFRQFIQNYEMAEVEISSLLFRVLISDLILSHQRFVFAASDSRHGNYSLLSFMMMDIDLRMVLMMSRL